MFTSNNINPSVNIINLGSKTIFPYDSARNLGVIFQSDMSEHKQISFIVKSCFL